VCACVCMLTRVCTSLSHITHAPQGVAFDNTLHSYDWRYYQSRRLKSEYAVDNEAIKLYFPLRCVA
jgi:Zn-dependent oligopeptidase